MTAPHWEHFSHGADIGVRGIGGSSSEAFEQAALAMTSVVTDLGLVVPDQRIELDCDAPDQELLLVEWLNSLIYEMATRKMLFSRFEVQLEGTSLHGSAWGERVDREKHQPAVEIKGATYTELKVQQEVDGSWCAQCVVDV
jgi:SHS2 domain-containing protein